nr:immunoglobulin light chain junction region [Macaca mulatta]
DYFCQCYDSSLSAYIF